VFVVVVVFVVVFVCSLIALNSLSSQKTCLPATKTKKRREKDSDDHGARGKKRREKYRETARPEIF